MNTNSARIPPEPVSVPFPASRAATAAVELWRGSRRFSIQPVPSSLLRAGSAGTASHSLGSSRRVVSQCSALSVCGSSTPWWKSRHSASANHRGCDTNLVAPFPHAIARAAQRLGLPKGRLAVRLAPEVLGSDA